MEAQMGRSRGALAEKVQQMAGITDWTHAAVALLPPPGGSSNVTFREAASQDSGEIQHQRELRFPERQGGTKAPSLAELSGLAAPAPAGPATEFVQPEKPRGLQYSKDQLKEWGYPEYDPNFDDPEWLKEQFRKEREDPRENANFFLTQDHPEFWNNAARKPHNQALLQSDSHWKSRRNTWLEQFKQVQETNKSRGEVAEYLEDCSMATKRLVTPIMHFRAVELYLKQVAKQSEERGVPFAQLIETAENQRQLRDYRNTLDMEGSSGADRLFQAINQRSVNDTADEERRRKLEGPKTDSSMKEIQECLGFAAKYRKDGLVEWERGQHEEALKAWRLGCEALSRIRVPETHPEEKKYFAEVQLALLKNRAQAAIKLLHWQEALESADLALKIDDQDHKAWFRKACALEGLGRLEEVDSCLDMIDGIAVGRPDRERLEHETLQKREKVRSILQKDEASQQRMLQLGLQKGLFSEERDRPAITAKSMEDPPAPPALSHKLAVANVDDATRKRLTHDGAEDLLKELEQAYSDPSFRQQVRKLARDVRNKDEFVCYLNKVALPIQTPLLEKWGFEASELGVSEMRRAIQDHTLGERSDKKLKRQAEATMRALYGEMYDPVRGEGLRAMDRAPASAAATASEKDRLKLAEARLQRRLQPDEGYSSDEEKRKKDQPKPYAHWTGLPTDSRSAVEKRAQRPQGVACVPTPVQAQSEPKKPCSAQTRKQIWAELSKAQSGGNAAKLREALENAVAAGFSAVTVRSAKKALVALGGNVDGL
eukprot:TRINITY_DN79283_c0_g1_i1.p1 TRINITY_DN79283_c0_g1~~TRINITY_DN79283_c0_g1_i1.p1  ORF type:complete len:771 (-),score=229.47 TRINITY_DN79283_c0_g1_i1:27-2339(-)